MQSLIQCNAKFHFTPAQKREGYWRHWLATGLVILSIIAYSILSGAGPAAQRACIMGIILVLAPRFGRIYNFYTAMALTVFIMSIFDPFVLWFCGVDSICTNYPS